MAQLADNLRALRPGLAGSPAPGSTGRRAARLRRRRRGGGRARRPRGARRTSSPRRSRLDRWTTSTSRRWSASSGPGAVRGLRARCASWSASCERQGYLTRGDDGLPLTPRALRRLGETALRRVFAQLDAAGHGEHDDQRPGAADERTGLTRPWEFGDERPLDVVADGRERRCAGRVSSVGRWSGPLEVEDFEVAETERRTSAAVALCVDLSFSMVQEAAGAR